MPLADYAHWNEDAQRVWWEEEGRHPDEPSESFEEGLAREDEALDAFWEEVYDLPTDDLLGMYESQEYEANWPKAHAVVRDVLYERDVVTLDGTVIV